MKKESYSKAELLDFKKIILKKLEKAQEMLSELNEEIIGNGTDDTSGGNNKIFESGFEATNKEEKTDQANRQRKSIFELKNALVRIDNGTYGICEETGELIQKERLMAMPTATLTIKAINNPRNYEL